MAKASRLKLYIDDNRARSHVMYNIKNRQSGLCWHCRKEITLEDQIITKTENKTKYYHKACAEFIHLI